MKRLELYIGIALIVVGILTRTVFHLGENIEFITAIGLISALLFSSKKLSFVVLVVPLLISDLIIGNSIIFTFTWSGFLFTFILGSFLGNFRFDKFVTMLSLVTASGIISSVFFFLWTNLGVVLTTNLYEKSLSGLTLSYINALPFFKNQLLGNLIIVPLVFSMVYIFLKAKSLVLRKLATFSTLG